MAFFNNKKKLIKATDAAKTINPQQFIAQGIKGAQIKTALENARLEIFKDYFS
ncbi:hypothetical protein [Pseudoalteromonas sp. SaAl2]